MSFAKTDQLNSSLSSKVYIANEKESVTMPLAYDVIENIAESEGTDSFGKVDMKEDKLSGQMNKSNTEEMILFFNLIISRVTPPQLINK